MTGTNTVYLPAPYLFRASTQEDAHHGAQLPLSVHIPIKSKYAGANEVHKCDRTNGRRADRAVRTRLLPFAYHPRRPESQLDFEAAQSHGEDP